MTELSEFLKSNAVENLLPGSCLEEARGRFSVSHAEIERHTLQSSLLPARYQRHHKSITIEQQLILFNSRVTVVGCGGLGGYIVEQLARLGIGEIQIVDDDVFEDHNLNRQLYASPQVLGKTKVGVAAKRIKEINPAVCVIPVTERFNQMNGCRLLAESNVVADAVDCIVTRHQLAESCSQLGIPMVHGAIAGWYGHICTIYPGDKSLEKIYPDHGNKVGIEQDLGNPAFTPAVIASFEVAEICKVLLGKSGQLRNRTLTIDLLDMEIEEFLL